MIDVLNIPGAYVLYIPGAYVLYIPGAYGRDTHNDYTVRRLLLIEYSVNVFSNNI